MSTKSFSINNVNPLTLIMAFVLVAVIAFVSITHIRQNQDKTQESSAETTETVEYEYEEMFADRNTSESLMRLSVCNPDGGSSPAVRNFPEISNSTFIGRISSGTDIYVSKAWVIHGDSDNTTWYGVLYTEVVTEIKNPIAEPKIKDDGIVWLNGYYAEVFCRDKDPGIYDNQDYKIYTRYEGEYQISVSGCALRSAPETGSEANVYGEISGTIYASVIYENGFNNFYGVPASSIKNSMLKNRVGDVSNDPDGIVWFSTRYASTINPV